MGIATPPPSKKVVTPVLAYSPKEVRQRLEIAVFLRWGFGHWESFESLIMHESWFNQFIENPLSGACGIFQALPCSKLGGDMSLEHQIEWGLNYIANRYGDPENAWEFRRKNGWY